jgi:hypothetical protein
MLKGFYREAKTDSEKEAAKAFATFVFGDDGPDVLDGKKTYVSAKEEKRVDPERQQFLKERFQAFEGDVVTSAKNSLLSSITSKDKNGKSKLDPDEVFSPWMTAQLSNSILEDINNQLKQDKDHMKYMNGLWKKAEEAKFTSEWKTRIIDAFLARARQLVPVTRSRIVSEALGTTRKRADKTRENVERNRRPEGGGGGRPANGNSGAGKRIDYTKTSDEDILNDNVTYK